MFEGRTLGGRYRLDGLIGGGGMGAVWRAHDLRLDRPVAIKVLAGEGLTDPTARERFDREARVVARLAHPNIVAVHDFDIENGEPYLVMEFVEGTSVATMLTHGALPINRSIAIAAQACDGLAAAHAAGVIHRDIKPANLIVTPAGLVKICDFGIARLVHAAGQPALTGTALAMGSSRYMAPEQVNGESVDARTDLYGLGCTLYAMVTGSPPFAGDNPLAVVEQHLNAAPSPMRARRPDAPPELAALVDELLAKAAEDRPADADAVRARLVGLLHEAAPAVDLRQAAASPAAATATNPDEPTAPALRPPAAPAGDAPTAPTPARRRRRLAGIGLAVLLAIVSIASIAAGCLPTTRDAPPSAVDPTGTRAPGSPTTSAGPSLIAEGISSAAPSASRTPTPAPSITPTRTARPPVAPPPTDPIADMRLTVATELAAGRITAKTATDISKKIDEIEQKVAENNVPEAMKKIKELRDKLAQLHKDGKLTVAAYQSLVGDLDRIEATLT